MEREEREGRKWTGLLKQFNDSALRAGRRLVCLTFETPWRFSVTFTSFGHKRALYFTSTQSVLFVTSHLFTGVSILCVRL